MGGGNKACRKTGFLIIRRIIEHSGRLSDFNGPGRVFFSHRMFWKVSTFKNEEVVDIFTNALNLHLKLVTSGCIFFPGFFLRMFFVLNIFLVVLLLDILMSHGKLTIIYY